MRYKARSVAKCYNHKLSTIRKLLSQVAKMNTVRIQISLAMNVDWRLQQYADLDAFFYGDLEEEIYLQIHLG